MKTRVLATSWLCVFSMALATLLGAPPAGAALILYNWTVDGKPPTTVNDLHLHLQIVKTPFTFGGVLIDDGGNFTTSGGTTPASDGSFSVDFGGATPAYGPTDNVHVAFNFLSSEDVKLLLAEWTFDGVVVGIAQDLQVDIRQTAPGGSAPEPISLALLGLGLAGLSFSRRKKA
jgi:hypothetical protein